MPDSRPVLSRRYLAIHIISKLLHSGSWLIRNFGLARSDENKNFERMVSEDFKVPRLHVFEIDEHVIRCQVFLPFLCGLAAASTGRPRSQSTKPQRCGLPDHHVHFRAYLKGLSYPFSARYSCELQFDLFLKHF